MSGTQLSIPFSRDSASLSARLRTRRGYRGRLSPTEAERVSSWIGLDLMPLVANEVRGRLEQPGAQSHRLVVCHRTVEIAQA